LPKKRGKENFRAPVADCLSTIDEQEKGALTPEMVRKFSHQAQTYILSYFFIEHKQENNISKEGIHEINIERIKREFKTHRSAIDYDEKFIKHCFWKQEVHQTPAAAGTANSNIRINRTKNQT
jgi:hypothetical protein